MNSPNLFKRPSAFMPVAMSLAALALVLGYVLIFGAAREADEGAVAHTWQLLIVGQLPLVLFFLVKWLPQAPRSALPVLALQAFAFVAALSPVYFLNL